MFKYSYTLASYSAFAPGLATLFHSQVHNNRVDLAPPVGNGFFQVVPLDGSLEAFIYDFTLQDTLVLHRKKQNFEFYTLVFEVLNDEGFRVVIDQAEPPADMGRTTVFYLSSFLYGVEMVVEKNVHVKGIRVLLDTPWMRRYLQLEQNEAVLGKYLALKSAGVWYKPVNDELRALLAELLEERDIPLLFYENKIMHIIEVFFKWLYGEMHVGAGTPAIHRRDIEQAQKIESWLTQNLTQQPPTIRNLARSAAISESKLKKIFRTVYGLPPYEYFQKQRMKKARQMLLSGRFSVKDVGYSIGYVNLSNFTLAFKKAYRKLPSELLRGNN